MRDIKFNFDFFHSVVLKRVLSVIGEILLWLTTLLPLGVIWAGCYIGPHMPSWADIPFFLTCAVFTIIGIVYDTFLVHYLMWHYHEIDLSE